MVFSYLLSQHFQIYGSSNNTEYYLFPLLLQLNCIFMILSEQKVLHKTITTLLSKFKTTTTFDLIKPSGTKYSIIQDLVLWLNERHDLRFGIVERTTQSLKSRKIVIKDLTLKHLHLMDDLFDKNNIDPNNYQMIYPRFKLYIIDDKAIHKPERKPLSTPTWSHEKQLVNKKEIYQQQQEFTTQVQEQRQKQFKTQKQLKIQKQFKNDEKTRKIQVCSGQEGVQSTLVIPNITVCFIKGDIGFVKTSRLREIIGDQKQKSDEQIRQSALMMMIQNSEVRLES